MTCTGIAAGAVAIAAEGEGRLSKRWGCSSTEETVFQRDGDGGGLAVDVEFAVEATHDVIEGMEVELKAVGHFLFQEAVGHAAEDLEFAFGEAVIFLDGSQLGEHFEDAFGDVGVHGGTAAQSGGDAFEDGLHGGRLKEVAAGACADGAEDFFIFFEDGEDEDLEFWRGSFEVANALDAIHAWEAYIQEDNIGGRGALEGMECVFAEEEGAHVIDAREGAEGAFGGFAEGGVVFDDPERSHGREREMEKRGWGREGVGYGLERGSGISRITVVPSPGWLWMRQAPPRVEARSWRLWKPVPEVLWGAKPLPWSRTWSRSFPVEVRSRERST